MSNVDLSWLIGGKSFAVPCTLSRNGCGVKTTALADSRANAFALLDTKCAKKISEFLNTLLQTLNKPIPVKGYNRQMGNLITLILQVHLWVDRQQQYNVPFLITDLGHYNVILRQKWLAYLDLWLNVQHQQLIWPTNLSLTPLFAKEITISMENLLDTTTNLAYQLDAIQRD